MRFYVNIWNHGDNPFAATPLFTYLRNGLTLAGHETAFTDRMRSGGINVLLEHFTRANAEQILGDQQRGAPFILLATEVMGSGLFNAIGHDASSTTYANATYWQRRYDAFCMLAESAEAIWLVSEYQRPGYEQKFGGKKIVSIPASFDPIEAGLQAGAPPPKIHDALFLGSLTDTRRELLSAIRRRVDVFHPLKVPHFAVPNLVASARVCLHLNLKANWPYTSLFRHHLLLTYGGYVIAEQSTNPGELDDFVELVPRQDVVEAVAARVADPRLPELTLEMRRRYAEASPIGPAFRDLVRETFAIDRGDSALSAAGHVLDGTEEEGRRSA